MKKVSIIFLLLVSIFVFTNSASAMVQVIQREIIDPSRNVKILVPQILGMENAELQNALNIDFEAYVKAQSDKHLNTIANLSLEYKLSSKKDRPWENAFINGKFVITSNANNIFSITQNFDTFSGNARIEHFVRGITANTKTGKIYKLADLFLADKDYKQVINDILNKNIETRYDRKFIKFTGITDDQDFYLEQDNLVIFFGMYTLDKTSSDIMIFTIPISSLTDYLDMEKFK